MLLQFCTQEFVQDEYWFNYKQKAAVKRKIVVIGSCFPWKLTFYCKKILQFTMSFYM